MRMRPVHRTREAFEAHEGDVHKDRLVVLRIGTLRSVAGKNIAAAFPRPQRAQKGLQSLHRNMKSDGLAWEATLFGLQDFGGREEDIDRVPLRRIGDEYKVYVFLDPYDEECASFIRGIAWQEIYPLFAGCTSTVHVLPSEHWGRLSGEEGIQVAYSRGTPKREEVHAD